LIEGCVASLSLRVCLLSVHRFNVSQIFFPLFLFARDGKEYYLAGKVRENRVEEKDRRGVGREKVEDKWEVGRAVSKSMKAPRNGDERERAKEKRKSKRECVWKYSWS
jgi:hypothetical protein